MPTIHYLAEYPQHIPTLAAWHDAQWGHLNPAKTLEARIEGLQAALTQSLGKSGIPTTFIAVDGPRVLGSASLVAHDMDLRMNLSPWLASVFVDPACRGQQIGSLLVERVAAEAAALGVARLYLFTPDRQTFYARIGWQTLEQVEYRGELETVMVREL